MPVSQSDIEAWTRLNRVTLRPWELAALDRMEIVRLRWVNRDTENEPEIVEGQTVTPALVQALFG